MWMLLTEPTYNRTLFSRARLVGEESKPEDTTQRITLLRTPRVLEQAERCG
jgi:hypothetical protein